MRQPKNVAYAILIICEGENTEPSFFNSIKDRIIDGVYKLTELETQKIKIEIRPTPKEETEETEQSSSIHKPKRNNRKLKKIDEEENKEKVALPLKYVIEGQEELQDNTFNEVWAVFDHDNHPARKEAFKKAEVLINGKQINIAFSSISFEYYLLLHFERINKAFLKSQCRGGREERREIYNCGTGEHSKDCNGDKCVGGYARINGYWKETKDRTIPVFPLIQGRLETGFINSAWLRHVSEKENKKLAIYDRNPYLTTDALVKRLTGNDNHEYEWVDISERSTFNGVNIEIKDTLILIENTSKKRILIPESSFYFLDDTYSQKECFGLRIDLEYQQNQFFEIDSFKKSAYNFILFIYEHKKIIFCL